MLKMKVAGAAISHLGCCYVTLLYNLTCLLNRPLLGCVDIKMPDNKWLNIEQAAQYISERYGKVSGSFVRALIRRGLIAYIQLGKAYYVVPDDLDECIKALKRRNQKEKK